MAKTPITETANVDLRIDGKADLTAYRREMEDLARTVGSLKGDLKKLADLTKAFTTKGLLSGNGNVGTVAKAAEFQGTQEANRLLRLGNLSAQNVETQRERLSLVGRVLKVMEKEEALQMASQLSLRTKESTLRKITDMKELELRLEATRIRKALEFDAGNRKGVVAMERQQAILQDQVRIVSERARAEQQTQAKIQRQREQALQAGVKEEFNAIRKAAEDRIREEQRAQDRIARQRQQAIQAGVKEDFNAIRKAAEDRIKAEQRAQDRIASQRQRAIDAENLRLIKEGYKQNAAPETYAARAGASSFREYMAGAVRKRAEMIQLDRTEAEIRAKILTQYDAGMEKAALTSRIRKAGQAGLTEEVRLLEKQLQVVNQINQALSKQPKPAVDRQAKLSTQRQDTTERLFGDGGAHLLAIQAGLAANYMVLNGVRSAFAGSMQFTSEFDEALRNMQAISVVTDTNLKELRNTIIGVSQETKFMATDVAEAALILGQAGFSTQEISQSIEAVSLLAAATGTDLKQSVDIATSVLGVFSMESSQMTSVANTLTSAVNMSKLNIDKLALGLQYAGNTAAQSGVSFEELTAALGAMSNAGIRSGSTLGTGMRQILISLEKPSEGFKASLDRLGISMADIDLRANGLYGVMQNLKEGGFTASDAIRSFEVRAAAAFNALSGNLDDVVALERSFLNQTSAMQANETQMRAMVNEWRRFVSNLQVVVSTALEPLGLAFRDLVGGMANVLQTLGQYPAALKVVGTAFGSMAISVGLARGALLGWNLVKMIPGLLGVASAAKTLTGAVEAAGTAAAVTGVKFSTMLGPIGVAVAAALAIGITAWSSYRTEMERANEAVDQARTRFDDATGVLDQVTSEINMLDAKIKELSDRAGTLTENQNLLNLESEKVREQFRGMGIELGETVSSVDELITALTRLRGKLDEKYLLQIGVAADSLQNLIAANQAKMNSLAEQVPSKGVVQGYLTNNRYNPQIKLTGQQIMGAANAPNNTLLDNQTLLTSINSRLALYDQAISEGLEMSSTERGSVTYLRKAQELLQQIVEVQSAQVSLQRQLADTRQEEDQAKNRQSFGALDQEVRGFTQGGYGQLVDSTKGIKNDPIREFEIANEVFQQQQTTADALIEKIKGTAGLREDVKEAMIQEIQNAEAANQKFVDQLIERAKAVSSDNRDLKQALTSIQDTQLEKQMGQTGSLGDLDSITAKRYGVVNETFSTNKQALDISFGGNTTSAKYQAELLKLEQDRDAQREKIQADFTAAITRITQRDVDATARTVQDIQLTIRETGENSFEERAKLYDALEEAIGAQFDAKEMQLEKSVSDTRERAERIADLRQEERELLIGVAEQRENDRIAEAERAIATAQNALTNVELLAEKATSLEELNEILKEAMVKVAQLAWASLKKAMISSTDDYTLGDAATDVGKMWSELNGKMATWQGNVKKYGHAGGKKFSDAAGGGGGGGGKGKSAVDLMLEQVESRVKSVEALLKADLLDSSTGIGSINGIIDDTKKKLSDVDAKIASMQGRVNGSQMSEEDLEQLNDLLKAREGLAKAAAEAEAMLTQEMIKQGDYWGAAKNITLTWAKENLDVTKTFTEGVQGVLSSLTSGFAQLFTDLSNKPREAKEAFRTFAISVIQSMQQMIAKMLAVYAMQKLIGWATGTGAVAADSFSGIARTAVGLPLGGSGSKMAVPSVDTSRLNSVAADETMQQRSVASMVGTDAMGDMVSMGNKVMARGNHAGVAKQEKGPLGMTNVYVVPPEQRPVPGPHDIIAVINDDIARGGSTKKLIKSVAMGY